MCEIHSSGNTNVLYSLTVCFSFEENLDWDASNSHVEREGAWLDNTYLIHKVQIFIKITPERCEGHSCDSDLTCSRVNFRSHLN